MAPVSDLHEAYLPTKAPTPRPRARVPFSHEDTRRAAGHPAPPPKRAEASGSVGGTVNASPRPPASLGARPPSRSAPRRGVQESPSHVAGRPSPRPAAAAHRGRRRPARERARDRSQQSDALDQGSASVGTPQNFLRNGSSLFRDGGIRSLLVSAVRGGRALTLQACGDCAGVRISSVMTRHPRALLREFFGTKGSRLAKHTVLAVLRLYQHVLSPDHGPLRILFPLGCCRYTPTCSAYAIQAVSRYGFRRGVILSVRRIVRCHPWAEGGFDPLPSPVKDAGAHAR